MKKIKVKKDRYEKAKDYVVTKVEKDHYAVRGHSINGSYSIRFYRDTQKFTCSCQDYLQRGELCKHIIAVLNQFAKNVEMEIED